MDWQEAAVAAIVGTAVVSLYRHLRGIFATPRQAGGGASCHGCGDCEPEESGLGSAQGSRVSEDPTGTVH